MPPIATGATTAIQLPTTIVFADCVTFTLVEPIVVENAFVKLTGVPTINCRINQSVTAMTFFGRAYVATPGTVGIASNCCFHRFGPPPATFQSASIRFALMRAWYIWFASTDGG